jgi:hypothetical protein
MSSTFQASFRTKTGLCVITPEQICLTQKGIRGALAIVLRYVFSVWALAIVIALILVAKITGRAESLFQSQVISALLPLAIFGLFLGIYNRSRDISAAVVIQRKYIQSIIATGPNAPVMRGYFIVHFLDGARLKKRFIILPGALDGGQAEFDHALELFRSSGFPIL